MSSELDDQHRVLSEVSHDLANRFHRSYYFLDLIGDVVAEGGEEAVSLVERLRESVSDIEAMARGALEFVRPLELRRLTVSVSDLVASLRQHAGMRDLDLDDSAGAGACRVSVDPTRIAEALAVLGREATRGDDGTGPLRVELSGGAMVGIRVRLAASFAPGARPALALAQCARIARAHGGGLEVDDREGAMTLRLPSVEGGS